MSIRRSAIFDGCVRPLRFALCAAFLSALIAVPASASTITVLSVQPGDANLGTILVSSDPADPKALAAAFALTSTFTNVSLSVELACLQCQAQFYLMKNAIGPASNFIANVQAVATVDTLGGGGFFVQTTPLFAGLTLDAGTYYLVMSLTTQSISGAVWAATQAPIVTAASGASNLGDFMALTAGYNVSTPPLSTFQAYQVSGIDTYLQFTLTSTDTTTTPVPEPVSVLLVLVGLPLLARLRRTA